VEVRDQTCKRRFVVSVCLWTKSRSGCGDSLCERWMRCDALVKQRDSKNHGIQAAAFNFGFRLSSCTRFPCSSSSTSQLGFIPMVKAVKGTYTCYLPLPVHGQSSHWSPPTQTALTFLMPPCSIAVYRRRCRMVEPLAAALRLYCMYADHCRTHPSLFLVQIATPLSSRSSWV